MKVNSVQKETNKLKIYESVPFGILLALVGGFLDAYTYIGRHGVFANAQTGNMVLLGIHASNGEWKKALMYFPPILAFILGVIVVEIIKKVSAGLYQFDWVQFILMLEVAVLVIVGFIPVEFPDLIVTVVISFVASVQVCAFSKLVDTAYATTMMTGNLRSFSQAAYKAFVSKDRKEAVKAARYMIIILTFLLGAVIGGIFTLFAGVKAVWGAAMILLCCAVIINLAGSKRKK